MKNREDDVVLHSYEGAKLLISGEENKAVAAHISTVKVCFPRNISSNKTALLGKTKQQKQDKLVFFFVLANEKQQGGSEVSSADCIVSSVSGFHILNL